jgi:hypothetical protein
MSKITLALGSFAVGLLVGSLFLGSHTVTFAQAPSSLPSAPPATARKYQFTDVSVSGATGSGIEFGKEAVVPGLGPALLRLHVNGGAQVLDGLDCDDCDFIGATLKYAGGAVRLKNPLFSGIVRVELTGAAANTAALLPLLSAIAAGQTPNPVNPNKPILETASLKAEVKLADWQTPYQK